MKEKLHTVVWPPVVTVVDWVPEPPVALKVSSTLVTTVTDDSVVVHMLLNEHAVLDVVQPPASVVSVVVPPVDSPEPLPPLTVTLVSGGAMQFDAEPAATL